MANLSALPHVGPASRPTSSFSNYSASRSRSRRAFYAASSSSSSASGKDDANDDGDNDDDGVLDPNDSFLPFPSALPRRDFLAPDFDPAAYLSALHAGGPATRHQTLEDLRSELRERGAAISAELLELVNANYAAFLGLGDGLRGGEDRVEDVRVALLGFRRAVEEVLARVAGRRRDVAALSGELGGVRNEIEAGRRMLELDQRLASLEDRLVVEGYGAERNKALRAGDEEEDDDDVDDEWDADLSDDDGEGEESDGGGGFVCSSPSKLAALARDYIVVQELADTIGRDTPFVKKTDERMIRCRNTTLLDLSTAVKEARGAGVKGQPRLLKLLAIYRALDAESEAVQVLKE